MTYAYQLNPILVGRYSDFTDIIKKVHFNIPLYYGIGNVLTHKGNGATE